MHSYHRSSSSFLPSICSFQTFIGVAVVFCVCITLQNSVTLNQKSVPSEHIKTSLSPPSLPYGSPLDESLYSHLQREETSNETPETDTEGPETLGGLAKDFDITWGDGRGKFSENGDFLTLSIDNSSGSGFQSKDVYLYAKINMYIKLIPDNSAGTVTTFFLSSNGTTTHDEIDFEFLGNLSGQPYTIHTNIYTRGKGAREQQFYLWFDPTEDFHSYSILWNPLRIVFLVDGIPLREFKNMENYGIPFPKDQPMRIYSSLWNADDWATHGGRVKTDWSKAPFVASFTNFTYSACIWSFGSSSCQSDPSSLDSENAWLMEELDQKSLEKIEWVQENYMTYDYCKDRWRYSEGLPKECTLTKSKGD